MEPNQKGKKKLQLKKQAISNLSNSELQNVKGGEDQVWTTSIGNCTGWACCGETQTCTIIVTITQTITTVL